MNVRLFPDKHTLGAAAAEDAAHAIAAAVRERGSCRILAATGASQFEFLAALTASRDVPWPRVELFHLDEYVGLGADHPASFRRYLLERLVNKVPLGRHHLIDGKGDPQAIVRELGEKLAARPVDVGFAGIGENGHLAFNDPPADFETEEPYLVVKLDDACRRQQVGEGWFKRLEDVPTHAISISIRQLMRARQLLVCVPDLRKAEAVQRCIEGPVSPHAPGSILQQHRNVTVYLDPPAASRLRSAPALEPARTS